MRITGTHKEHRIQGRHIDALGETAGVGEDPTTRRGRAVGAGTIRPRPLQPLDPLLALEGIIPPIDMVDLAAERLGSFLFG